MPLRFKGIPRLAVLILQNVQEPSAVLSNPLCSLRNVWGTGINTDKTSGATSGKRQVFSERVVITKDVLNATRPSQLTTIYNNKDTKTLKVYHCTDAVLLNLFLTAVVLYERETLHELRF